MTALAIRPATAADADAIWDIVGPIVAAGDTYALPATWGREAVLAYWHAQGHAVFVAEIAGDVVGTYYLRANQQGGGDHVANCGYMTAARAAGQGIARRMCAHSLAEAAGRGFRAMQFNFVVSSNDRAIALWERMGFAIVGRLPGAFRHPAEGDIDALVMFRRL